MKLNGSHILIGSATLALGTMLAWGAAPATGPTARLAAVLAPQGGGGGGMMQMSPEDRAKAETDRLDKAVTLTDDQKTKVQAIYLKAAQDEAAAMQNGGDMSSFRTISQKATSDVKALLTPDQLAKFPAGRGRGNGGGGGGYGGGGGNGGGGGDNGGGGGGGN